MNRLCIFWILTSKSAFILLFFLWVFLFTPICFHCQGKAWTSCLRPSAFSTSSSPYTYVHTHSAVMRVRAPFVFVSLVYSPGSFASSLLHIWFPAFSFSRQFPGKTFELLKTSCCPWSPLPVRASGGLKLPGYKKQWCNWGGYSTHVEFCLWIHNLSLITRKYQTSPKWGPLW